MRVFQRLICDMVILLTFHSEISNASVQTAGISLVFDRGRHLRQDVAHKHLVSPTSYSANVIVDIFYSALF